MGDVILDAVIDTLWLAPVIIIMHLLLELCEEKLFGRVAVGKALLSAPAPAVAAAAGIIPQCGFPVVAAQLYSSGRITLGTLLAAFIATSDEALPVLLGSSPQGGSSAALSALVLLGLQLALALVVGYSAQLLFRHRSVPVVPAHEEPDHCEHVEGEHDEHEHCEGEHVEGEHGEHEHGEEEGSGRVHVCHGHVHGEGKFGVKELLLHTLRHSATVLAFVLIVNFVFGTVIYFIGEERLVGFLAGTKYAQPFVAALVGLIPNCAASVVIARLFALGGLSIGSALAGVGACAGIAYAVLLRSRPGRAVAIIAAVYAICSLSGLAVNAVAALI